MESIKLLIEGCAIGIVFLIIFVVQEKYKFTVVYNKQYKGYCLIWEEYTLNQEFKQKTIKLFRWTYRK